MAGSFHRINLHIVFSTKNRYPFLQDKEIRIKLFSYIYGLSKSQGLIPIRVGGWLDHVHILIRLNKKDLPEAVKYIKRESSRWLHKTSLFLSKFKWQKGYAVFSVSESMIPVVCDYIEKQEEHHRKMSFREEYLLFLKKNNIEYDKEYVFDGEDGNLDD